MLEKNEASPLKEVDRLTVLLLWKDERIKEDDFRFEALRGFRD